MFNEWVDITRQVIQDNRVRLLAVTGIVIFIIYYKFTYNTAFLLIKYNLYFVETIVYAGEGDIFCAGNDQHNIVDHYDPSLSEAELLARGQRIVRDHIACAPFYSVL